MKLRLVFLATALFLVAASRYARADGSGEAVAEALFQQARAEMKEGDFVQAYPKLLESQRIDPSNGTLLNLVICEERLGRLATAWVHGRELVAKLDEADERRPIVLQQLAALEGRVPTLEVHLGTDAPPDTRLSLDGTPLGSSSVGLPIPIDPGIHRVVVSVPGRPDRIETITAEEGRAYEHLEEPALSPRDEETLPSRAPHTPRHAARSHTIAWAAVASGIGGFVASAVFGVLAVDRAHEVGSLCPAKRCSDGSGLQAAEQGRIFTAATIVSLAVGTAGTGLGVYLLNRPDLRRPPESAPSLGGLVLQYQGDF